ncbi:HSP20-like chaperone [Tuber brumale]|nr:HSP20-like chaperone [Tuber brumale]
MPFFLTSFNTFNLTTHANTAQAPLERLLTRTSPSHIPALTPPTTTPKFDVRELPRAYILEGEFPGIDDTSSLCIEFTDESTLLIHGRLERAVTEPRAEAERGNYLVMERGVGVFQRRFWFEEGVEVEGVDASLGNGILRVYVPKRGR